MLSSLGAYGEKVTRKFSIDKMTLHKVLLDRVDRLVDVFGMYATRVHPSLLPKEDSNPTV